MGKKDPVLIAPMTSVSHAARFALVMTATGMLITAPVIGLAQASGIGGARPVLDQLLALTGSAASWVVPLYVTALVAALAVLVLPDWRERASESDFATVRRLIGQAAFWAGPAFAVWGVWILVAAILPGVAVGANGGVILALPVVLVLTVLVSRAAVGTLEQRLADAIDQEEAWREWRARVRTMAIRTGDRSASWPLWLVAGAIVAITIAGAWVDILLENSWSFMILYGAVHVYAATLWAARYFTASRASRIVLAILTLALVGVMTAGGVLLVVLWSFQGHFDVGWIEVGVAVLPALVYLVPWRGKRLLAGPSLRYVQRSWMAAAALRRELQSAHDGIYAAPARRWRGFRWRA